MTTALVSQGSYTASSLATIFTASAACTVAVSITNKSGGAGTITEISRSASESTDATGMLRGDTALADDGTLEITGIIMDGTVKYLQLACSVNVNYVINGVTHA